MANITLMGASYTDVPAVDLPQTGGGTVRFYENGGGGGGMVTENIIPQQSLNCSISLGDDAYGAVISSYVEYPQDGVEYLVTFDGTEYICRGHYRTSSILAVGDYYITAGATYVEFPFAVLLNGGSLFYLAVHGSATHTLKVDKIISYSGGGGGGGSATLITKTITQNGTYDAEDDSADGYSSVTVNVPTGASNVVTGTFKGTTTGAAMDVNLNYSGTGYPIAVMIYPEEGTANPNGDYYPTLLRGAIMFYSVIKNVSTTAPTYTGGTNDDTTYTYRNKSSTTNASTTGAGGGVSTKLYNDTAAASGLSGLVKIRSNKKLSVYILSSSGSSNGGFMANIDYRYIVYYSS